jgi:hypothetical protein
MNKIKVGSDKHFVILQNEPLSNFQLLDAVKQLKIKNFRGVFLRNELPKQPRKNECGILNLDSSDSLKNGTHWVAWYKKNLDKIYFDSYGIQPPLEIIEYLGENIYYPTEQIQQGNQVFCGHLCLYILFRLDRGARTSSNLNTNFQEIINELF